MQTFRVRAKREPGWWDLTTFSDDGVEVTSQVISIDQAADTMRDAIAEATDTSTEHIRVLVIPDLLTST